MLSRLEFVDRLWVVRVHLFLVILVWPLVFWIPETHGQTILAHRARRLRTSGTNPNAYAQHELHGMSKAELLNKHLLRPAGTFVSIRTACSGIELREPIAAMLIHEPIILGAALWISLAYGIL